MSAFRPVPEGVSESAERRGDLGGRAWRRAGNRAACLCIHGIADHSEWFRGVAGQLAALGTDVWAFDRRGTGLSRGEWPFVGSFETHWSDHRGLAVALRAEYDRLHLAGVSWGALLGVVLAARDPDHFDSLSLLAPGFRFRPGALPSGATPAGRPGPDRPDRPVDLPVRPEAFTAVPEALAYVRGDPLRARSVPAGFLADLPGLARAARRLAPSVTSPVLLLLADGDEVVDPRAARAGFEHLGASDKHRRTFVGARHALVLERPEELARELADRFASAPKRKLSVLVAGAGALGGYLAARLARRGHPVSLLCRPAQAAVIAGRGGLAVRELGAEELVRGVEALAELPAGRRFDLVVMAVKGFDTGAAAEAAAGCVDAGTTVASFQDGLGNEEFLAQRFPEQRVLAGAACLHLSSPEPGVVESLGGAAGVGLASYRGVSGEELLALAEVFRAAGLPAVTGRAAAVKWSRLLLRIGFEAPGAATGLTVGRLLARTDTFALAAAAFREAMAAARASGAEPLALPGWPAPLFCRAMALPAWLARPLARLILPRPERERRSAMWRDLSAGRGRTEIANLNGAVVRAAERAGLTCPVNRYLVEVLDHLAGSAAERERLGADPGRLFRESPLAPGARARPAGPAGPAAASGPQRGAGQTAVPGARAGSARQERP